ncbi:FHA domain-containing protein [Granulicoccus sp. GXG6511]|uniref:FHA domain-containing protein n=1 Tax=Granulicoccus sp. GXG6511 TaxID=3381351 RepID=UPI003D7DD7FD
MNAPGALFCEACGYDYTTGTMPRPPEPSILDLDSPLPEAAAPDVTEAPEPSAQVSPAAPPDADAGAADDLAAPAPARAAEERTAAPELAPAPPESASETFDWVLEVWVDPEWYALQDSPDPMPSAGLPDIVPLRKRTLLIGRPSRSRNINPDIDCEPDTGISRRQAQLSTDGTRWFIEDLGSANGTFVADAAGGLPSTPIPTGRRRELSGDERIYLGAWTRLVLRRATPEEQEAFATA